MPLDNFITRPDFSRQIKQYSGTTAFLSGITSISEKLIVKNTEIDTANPLVGNVLVYNGEKFLPAAYDAYGEVILRGMILSYKSGLTYNISSGEYRMYGATYVYTGGSITINSGNSLYSRFDIVYVTGDTKSLAFVLSGTPSPTPTVPSLVEGQLQVGIIAVGANFTGGTGSTLIQVTSDTVFEYYTTSTGIQRAGAYNAEASGQYSFALSRNTRAYGQDSVALGLGATASGQSQTVVGQYNSINNSDYFIVGNGATDGSRSNAFRVTSGGNAYITNKLFITNIELETTGASNNFALIYDGTKFKPQSLLAASGAITGLTSAGTGNIHVLSSLTNANIVYKTISAGTNIGITEDNGTIIISGSGNYLALTGGTLTGDLIIKQDKSLTIVNSGNSAGSTWTAASITFYDNNPIYNNVIKLIPVNNNAGDSTVLLKPSLGNSYIPVGNVPIGADQLMVGNGITGFDFISKTDLPYLALTGGTVTGDVLVDANLSADTLYLYDSPNYLYGSISLSNSQFYFKDVDNIQRLVVDKNTGLLITDVNNSAYTANLTPSSLTDIRTYSFPDKSGTFALLSDLTGATGSSGLTSGTSLGDGVKILFSSDTTSLSFATLSSQTPSTLRIISSSTGVILFSSSSIFSSVTINNFSSNSITLISGYNAYSNPSELNLLISDDLGSQEKKYDIYQLNYFTEKVVNPINPLVRGQYSAFTGTNTLSQTYTAITFTVGRESYFRATGITSGDTIIGTIFRNRFVTNDYNASNTLDNSGKNIVGTAFFNQLDSSKYNQTPVVGTLIETHLLGSQQRTYHNQIRNLQIGFFNRGWVYQTNVNRLIDLHINRPLLNAQGFNSFDDSPSSYNLSAFTHAGIFIESKEKLANDDVLSRPINTTSSPSPIIYVNKPWSLFAEGDRAYIGNTLVLATGLTLSSSTRNSWLDIGPSQTTKPHINLSAGTDVTSPQIGDLWWNGNQLYFRQDSNTTVNLLRNNLTSKNIGVTTNGIIALGGDYLYDKITLTSSSASVVITSITVNSSISSYTPSIRFFAEADLNVTFRNSTNLKTEGGLDALISGSTYDNITFEYNPDSQKFYQININNYI